MAHNFDHYLAVARGALDQEALKLELEHRRTDPAFASFLNAFTEWWRDQLGPASIAAVYDGSIYMVADALWERSGGTFNLETIETIKADVVRSSELEVSVRALVEQRQRYIEKVAQELAGKVHAKQAAEERLCASCKKRPRHFDDLCKRCANEAGTRPTGPVT